MPKMKTKKAAAKRFKVTKTGKLLRAKTGHAHLLSKKDARRKRRLKRPDKVHDSFVKRMKRVLGI